MIDINKKLGEELRKTLDGDTWYSSNFVTVINEIDPDTAVKKLRGFPNSIVEIVVHMTQWKRFCIKKIENDAAFDIALNSPEDWKRFNSVGEEEWQTIKKEYAEATEHLAAMIEIFPEDRLDDIVPGRDYPFFHLFVG